MTRREMLDLLKVTPFEPFRITMNNGQSYDVRHPENVALMITDSLYIFRPASDEPALKELLTIARIHNICTIEKPIDSAA